MTPIPCPPQVRSESTNWKVHGPFQLFERYATVVVFTVSRMQHPSKGTYPVTKAASPRSDHILSALVVYPGGMVITRTPPISSFEYIWRFNLPINQVGRIGRDRKVTIFLNDNGSVAGAVEEIVGQLLNYNSLAECRPYLYHVSWTYDDVEQPEGKGLHCLECHL